MTGPGRLFTAGAGKIDITPPLEIPYLGFSPRHSRFAAVHDPLFARSFVVSNGERTAAVVSAETIGFVNSVLGPGRNFTAEVRAKIRARTGIPGEAVMLTAAHVHSSPDTIDIRPLRETPGAVKWLEALISKIALSVEIARQNMFEAHLQVGRGEFAGYSRNRRGEPCIDNSVTVLSFQSPGSNRRIVLFNYACHPVIVQAQDRVSADYVGVATSALEREVPGLEACIFLQGACADIDPAGGDTRDFADVERMGEALGERLKNILDQMRTTHDPAPPAVIRYDAELLNLPSRRLPTPEQARTLETADNRMWLADELEARRREGENPFPAEVQVLRLGNSLLAGIPGEPFCRMGREVRRLAAPLIGIPVGYANGYVGYIAPPEAWEKGGYEVDPGPWSKVGPESYGMIAAAIERLSERLGA